MVASGIKQEKERRPREELPVPGPDLGRFWGSFVHKRGPLALGSAVEGIIAGESPFASGLMFRGQRRKKERERAKKRIQLSAAVCMYVEVRGVRGGYGVRAVYGCTSVGERVNIQSTRFLFSLIFQIIS